MVYKDVAAEIVEVVPFVFIVDEKVIAKIVEVVSFVFMVDKDVDAEIVEVARGKAKEPRGTEPG